jgi:glutamine cyclotransferase
MKKITGKILIILLVQIGVLSTSVISAEEIFEADMKKAESKLYQSNIPIEVIREIELPKGYHEGLMVAGDNIWVNNGEKINTWVVSLDSEEVIGEIEPAGRFSEGITATPDGKYWLTDWNTKKIYKVVLEENRMVPEFEINMAPSRPTGIVWNGEALYFITWTRGMGTEYHLYKMDVGGNIKSKIKIKRVHEPSQIAWDGKNLWISSWYSKRVYKIDIDNMQLIGHFKSPVSDTTGIVWDGEYMWLTGTHSDLYQIRIEENPE